MDKSQIHCTVLYFVCLNIIAKNLQYYTGRWNLFTDILTIGQFMLNNPMLKHTVQNIQAAYKYCILNNAGLHQLMVCLHRTNTIFITV